MTRLDIHRAGKDDPDGRRSHRLIVGARSGEFVRVAPGSYTSGAAWRAADEAERHRARIEAVLPVLAGQPIVSHASAVVLHGLPWIGRFPERITVVDTRRSTGQRRVHVDRFGGAGRSVRTDVIDGFPVTSLVVTAIDVALRYDRRRALSVLDTAMRRGVRRNELFDELDGRPNPRGAVRTRLLIELADPLSGSVGESVSRLLFNDLGMPTPVLQQRFVDRSGIIGDVDFWFPEQGAIVEFDGMVKYRDFRYRNDRSPEQVVIDEKIREDRLRAMAEARSFTRLIWRDVMPGGVAPTMLRDAGLPVRIGALTVPSDL